MCAKKAVKKATKKATKRKVILENEDDIGSLSSGKGIDFNALFGKAVEKVAKKADKDIGAYDGVAKSALVGVPFGNFALEVCFSETVLGLGRIICFDGMPASCKSSLLFEMCRIVDNANGASCVVDTEQKATENLGQGIVGYDNWHKIKFVSPGDFDEALKIVTGMIQLFQKAAKTHGKCVPLLIGVDSTNGAVSASEMEKMTSDGTASRSFDDIARISTKYLKFVTSVLSHLPIVLIGIRHERMVDNGYGIKIPEPKGAGAWGFHAYNTFHLARVGDRDLERAGGRDLMIHLKKGTDPGIKVPVTMWWQEEFLDCGESRRHFWFDWSLATFNILTCSGGSKVPKRFTSSMKDVLGAMTASGGKVVCKPLGLTTPAPPEELHNALYSPDNKKILDTLRGIYCVRVGQEFKCGDNFDDMKSKQRALILSRRSTDKVACIENAAEINDENTEVT